MVWVYGSILIIVLILYLYATSSSKEDFDNSDLNDQQYVFSDASSSMVAQYNTPDIDWKEIEASIEDELKSKDDKEEEEEEDKEEEEEEEEDKEEEEEEEDDSRNNQKRKRMLTSDQRYIRQKQRSAPRFVPKFSNDEYNVYTPKDPPLRYATRPGPNAFHDVLTEASHVETDKEREDAWKAQKNAEYRHKDLLHRLNWVYIEANKYSPDRILKQPKIIPGPSNESKYERKYSQYGRV